MVDATLSGERVLHFGISITGARLVEIAQRHRGRVHALANRLYMTTNIETHVQVHIRLLSEGDEHKAVSIHTSEVVVPQSLAAGKPTPATVTRES